MDPLLPALHGEPHGITPLQSSPVEDPLPTWRSDPATPEDSQWAAGRAFDLAKRGTMEVELRTWMREDSQGLAPRGLARNGCADLFGVARPSLCRAVEGERVRALAVGITKG